MADQNELRARQRKFREFLEQDHGRGKYAERINSMIEADQQRLIITLDDLRAFDAALARGLLQEPSDYIGVAEKALVEVTKSINEHFLTENPELFVGFDGNFGTHHITPRGLSASFLGHLVCLEGIVTKCYEVRAKVVKSVHYVPATGRQLEQVYSDAASISGQRTTVMYPKTDEAGNHLVTEFGLSTYHDNQMITMQEMPERAPAGQMPRSVDVILTNDLCDSLKPGDRVRIMGVYRAFPSRSQNSTSGVFRTALLGTHLERIVKAGLAVTISASEIKSIKALARKHAGTAVFHHLANSIAPSIYGHEWIKKAVLCMLLGGVEKNLDTGAHLRGDINLLMVGDPSTAKSQVLRFVMNTAPLAVATTGRGSSGVGLTAAVLTDQDTGEKRLEAGAMVLADRGVVCIDEFDKMSELDRVAIHEVMEQQTVTINKAAIHTTLNARCSVLAAANPIYGKYKEELTTMENVHLPDSLLSRFDLLFIVLDTVEPGHDRLISQHVLNNHVFRAPNEPDGFVRPSFVLGSETCMAGTVDEEGNDDKDDSIYEKTKGSRHHGRRRQDEQLLKQSFLRKYIQWAKYKFAPRLTTEASEYIAQEYVSLRASRVLKTQPITARTLETIIRLSTAMAKCRLSKEVAKEDAVEALKVLKFALFAEEPESEVDEALLSFNRAERKRQRLEEWDDSSYMPSSGRYTQDEDGMPPKRTRTTETGEGLLGGLPETRRSRPHKVPDSLDSTDTQQTGPQTMDSEPATTTQEEEGEDIQLTVDVSDPPHQLSFSEYSRFSADLGRWLHAQPDQRSTKTEAIRAMAAKGWTEGQAQHGITKLISLSTHLMEEGEEIFVMS